MRKLALITLATLAGLALGAGGKDLTEDPPAAPRPKPGDLAGMIEKAGPAGRLSAISRVTGQRYAPASFDAKTGQFLFKGLPGDARYDLCIVTGDKRRIEGIDLDWAEARLARLAEIRRKQLAIPAPPVRTFTEADARSLVKYLADLKDFTDTRRPLYLAGQGDKAAMLVEVMRTTDFYARKDNQVIWRMELWYFTCNAGGWEKQDNTERVLERERVPLEQWQAITLVYEPALSVYVDPDGKSSPVRYAIPDKLDPAKGRLAGTEFKQDTKPIFVGLPTATSRAARGE